MDEESYRHELRNHFMGQMKNSKLQSSAQYYKEQALRNQQDLGLRKMQEFDAYPNQGRIKTPHRNSGNNGGDADRMLYDNSYAGDTYRRNNSSSQNDTNSNYMRQLHIKAKQQTATLPSSSVVHKYREDSNNFDMYETDSNLGGGGAVSDESGKSQKSSKTVVSKKSSHELRKMVKSQCKLHEVIDETLKQMCSAETEPISEDVMRLKESPPPPPPSHRNCKGCSDKLTLRGSQKDVMTEIGKGDFLDCRSGDTLTISVDDVVNSKVINPMIRKLQRMYLNNLKEEMSLMEDLERLPHKVNEVYKATIFKQKE